MIAVREPDEPRAPVVASLPHGGEQIPEWVRGQMTCAPDELVNTDWFTPRLYEFLPQLGIATVETALNRYVVDPNREPSTRYGDFKRAAVAAATPWGRAIYDVAPDDDDLVRRLALGHGPYHAALDAALAETREGFDRVLLLDLHSFGPPLGTDVVVADAHGRTASTEARDLVVEALEREGFSIRLNHRFTGGWIVRRFADRADVDALMVELHYSCYLRTDGWPRARPQLDPARFADAQDRLRRAIVRVVAEYGSVRTPS